MSPAELHCRNRAGFNKSRGCSRAFQPGCSSETPEPDVVKLCPLAPKKSITFARRVPEFLTLTMVPIHPDAAPAPSRARTLANSPSVPPSCPNTSSTTISGGAQQRAGRGQVTPARASDMSVQPRLQQSQASYVTQTPGRHASGQSWTTILGGRAAGTTKPSQSSRSPAKLRP